MTYSLKKFIDSNFKIHLNSLVIYIEAQTLA